MGVPAANGRRGTGVRGTGVRRTTIGAFNVHQPGKSGPRVIPVPWIDCAACAWRHYPSTSGGVWHIATSCVSCGAQLESPAES